MIQRRLKPDDIIFGGGIIDAILSKFTYSKYPGEHHAYSLAPDTYKVGLNWMGPGTSLKDRLNDDYTPKQDSLPVRLNDKVSMMHDIAYDKINKAYYANPTKYNKDIQMRKIWNADDQFRKDVVEDTADPMSKVAEKLIHLKEIGEKLGTISSTRFSGFGATKPQRKKADPAKRLRELVLKNEKVKTSKKKIKGGFLPLATLAVPAVTAVVSTVVGKLFDLIRDKFKGSGIKLPMKYYLGNTNKEKLVNRIKEAHKRIIL